MQIEHTWWLWEFCFVEAFHEKCSREDLRNQPHPWQSLSTRGWAPRNCPWWRPFGRTIWCCSFAFCFRTNQKEPFWGWKARLGIPVGLQRWNVWRPNVLPNHWSKTCRIHRIPLGKYRLDYESRWVWSCSILHLRYISPGKFKKNLLCFLSFWRNFELRLFFKIRKGGWW